MSQLGERRRSRRKFSAEKDKKEDRSARGTESGGRKSDDGASASKVPAEKLNKGKSGKSSKHVRSKSASEVNRTKKLSPRTDTCDRKVKALKVAESDERSGKKLATKDPKKSFKTKRKQFDSERSDPLQVKLKELLELMKGNDSQEELFLDPDSFGDPASIALSNAKSKQRPHSAKLERKPPKPMINKRPQSARTEQGYVTSRRLSERHRARSSDSIDEILIDATDVSSRTHRGKSKKNGDRRKEAFVGDILCQELNQCDTDVLVWDVDISDCITRKKKRPVSGEY